MSGRLIRTIDRNGRRKATQEEINAFNFKFKSNENLDGTITWVKDRNFVTTTKGRKKRDTPRNNTVEKS